MELGFRRVGLQDWYFRVVVWAKLFGSNISAVRLFDKLVESHVTKGDVVSICTLSSRARKYTANRLSDVKFQKGANITLKNELYDAYMP